MFVKVTDNPLPKLYPEVVRKLPTLKEEGYDEVGGFRLRKNIDIIPQVGLQEDLCKSDADVVFMAGQATSGKTFAIMIDALRGIGKRGYSAAIISKRLADSSKGGSINRDARIVFDGFGGLSVTTNSGITTAYSEVFENSIRLIHSNFNDNNKKEWDEFQEYAKKSQQSFIAVDEVTDMSFKMFVYWFSRNRDSSGMRPRMVASFNPKFDHFTRGWIDWYIDPETHYVIPERVGKTRYFYIGNAKSEKDMIWGNSKQEVLDKVRIEVDEEEKEMGLKPEDKIKSFTFLTGTAAGNKILVNSTQGGSITNLANSGDADRLLHGYFGPIEEGDVNISDLSIRNLFTNPIDNDDTMYGILDVSAGGKSGDLCVFAVFKGLTLIHIEQLFIYNDPTSIEQFVERMLRVWDIKVKNFCADANGIGFFLRKYKEGQMVMLQSRPIQEYDEFGNVSKSGDFKNLRSQLLGKTEALILKGDYSISIPKDRKFIHGRNKTERTIEDILIDEKEVFKCSTENGKIYYNSKDEFKKRNGFSPDITDLIMLRSVFELDGRPRKEEEEELTCDDYYF